MRDFPTDANREFRTNKRYSGLSWGPTVGCTSPIICSRGGWSNRHDLNKSVNAFEKTAWQEISSPDERVHEMLGAIDPKTSQIGINDPASSGT